MKEFMQRFIVCEDGAVTIDWVLLAAGVISLALAAGGLVSDGTEDLTGDVEDRLTSQLISTTF